MCSLLFPAILAGASLPISAFAHAFGQQYTLPIPAEFYIAGGSAALILSFVLLLLSPHRMEEAVNEGRIVLGPAATGRILSVVRYAVLAATLAAVVTGLFGNQAPTENFAPLAFWIYFLLGFAYLSVFVGGLWEKINPFALPIPFIRHGKPDRTLPAWAYHLPALVLYFALIWLELMSEGAGAIPQFVALGLIGYWLASWISIDLYGKGAWKEHMDVFGVFFRTIGLLAPFTVGEEGIRMKFSLRDASLRIAESIWLVIFIISVLAFTAFDGFRETLPYAKAFGFFGGFLPFPVLVALSFFAMPVLFFGTYALCIFFVYRIRKGPESFLALLRTYAYSLVPIAIAYHFAHYFTLLIPNPGIIGAATVWYIQLAVIVAGHIVALYISHLATHRLVTERWRATIAELPLLAVMVFYTAFGLWILSRPFAL